MQRRTGVPGLAIVVVHADRVAFLRGYGVRRVGEPVAVDADTVFQLASLSKPIASTVVAGLEGDGRVGWDDPVLRTLPAARIGPPAIAADVTIRDLLAHRSGLPDHADYGYTNFGFTAGAVAAANRASLHVSEGGRWVPYYQRDADAQAPAGGVSSSVRDLGQWLRLQLAGGRLDGRALVDAAALAETHRPQSISQPPRDPATDRGTVQLSHSGAFDLGAATAVYLLPAKSSGIAVLSNGRPLGVPEALSLSFLDLATSGAVQRDYLAALRPPGHGTAVLPHGGHPGPAAAGPSRRRRRLRLRRPGRGGAHPRGPCPAAGSPAQLLPPHPRERRCLPLPARRRERRRL